MSNPNDKPGDPKQDRLLEHDADGIQEYDNPMPRWWVWIFWITIVWAALYWFNVIPGIGSGKGRVANYEAEVARAGEKYAAARAAAASRVSADAIWALAADPAAMAEAKQAFGTNCMACHLDDGGGSIGPNLTDDYWIHGARPMDVHRVIDVGVLDKGMPAWGEVLSPDDVLKLSAYVMTLHGTRPAQAREPQGTKFEYENGRPVAAESHDHESNETGAAEETKK